MFDESLEFLVFLALFPVFNSSGISMLTSVKLVVPIRC